MPVRPSTPRDGHAPSIPGSLTSHSSDIVAGSIRLRSEKARRWARLGYCDFFTLTIEARTSRRRSLNRASLSGEDSEAIASTIANSRSDRFDSCSNPSTIAHSPSPPIVCAFPVCGIPRSSTQRKRIVRPFENRDTAFPARIRCLHPVHRVRFVFSHPVRRRFQHAPRLRKVEIHQKLCGRRTSCRVDRRDCRRQSEWRDSARPNCGLLRESAGVALAAPS